MRVRVVRTAFVAVSILALTASAVFAFAGDPNDGKIQYMSEVAQNPPGWVAEIDATSAECVDGMAAIFPCENIDLASFVSLPELAGATGNDIWGWTDPQNGDEYAIMGTSDGTTFVDVTDPKNPDVVGVMPSQSLEGLPLWRDIKVYDNHAFVVSEHEGHGMQVFDLRRLRVDEVVGVDTPTKVFGPDAVYTGPEGNTVSNTHNMWINPDSGFAYLVGTNTCEGGPHMVDVRDPMNPTFAGCFAEDGYTHDVECVIYDGPDNKYRGHEICFASNEDSLTIVDVTDKSDPTQVSRTEYPTAAYTHQGGLTPGQDWFLFNDELDEMTGTVSNTTTYISSMQDLDAPGNPVPYTHDSQTIDHNLYIDDQFVYQSHYNEGLRIHEWSDELLGAGELNEVAYFDVVPAVDVNEFAGNWSNYRFDGSGTIVVSAIESGLFVLTPHLPAGDDGGGERCPPGKEKKGEC